MEKVKCDVCETEIDIQEVYYDFPAYSKRKLCQKCYDEYRISLSIIIEE
jgi:hypothetical protein